VPEKDDQDARAKLTKIGKLLAVRKQDDYESLGGRLAEARELFHDLLADRFVDTFNAHLASQPQDTAEQKQALARAANADLRKLGLTIRCPKTGTAAHLRGISRGSSSGSFQLSRSSNANYTRSGTSKSLPHIDLMIRPVHGGPNPSKPDSWVKRAGGQDDKGVRLPQ